MHNTNIWLIFQRGIRKKIIHKNLYREEHSVLHFRNEFLATFRNMPQHRDHVFDEYNQG